jgi:hypothetical protein
MTMAGALPFFCFCFWALNCLNERSPNQEETLLRIDSLNTKSCVQLFSVCSSKCNIHRSSIIDHHQFISFPFLMPHFFNPTRQGGRGTDASDSRSMASRGMETNPDMISRRNSFPSSRMDNFYNPNECPPASAIAGMAEPGLKKSVSRALVFDFGPAARPPPRLRNLSPLQNRTDTYSNLLDDDSPQKEAQEDWHRRLGVGFRSTNSVSQSVMDRENADPLVRGGYSSPKNPVMKLDLTRGQRPRLNSLSDNAKHIQARHPPGNRPSPVQENAQQNAKEEASRPRKSDSDMNAVRTIKADKAGQYPRLQGDTFDSIDLQPEAKPQARNQHFMKQPRRPTSRNSIDRFGGEKEPKNLHVAQDKRKVQRRPVVKVTTVNEGSDDSLEEELETWSSPHGVGLGRQSAPTVPTAPPSSPAPSSVSTSSPTTSPATQPKDGMISLKSGGGANDVQVRQKHPEIHRDELEQQSPAPFAASSENDHLQMLSSTDDTKKREVGRHHAAGKEAHKARTFRPSPIEKKRKQKEGKPSPHQNHKKKSPPKQVPNKKNPPPQPPTHMDRHRSQGAATLYQQPQTSATGRQSQSFPFPNAQMEQCIDLFCDEVQGSIAKMRAGIKQSVGIATQGHPNVPSNAAFFHHPFPMHHHTSVSFPNVPFPYFGYAQHDPYQMSRQMNHAHYPSSRPLPRGPPPFVYAPYPDFNQMVAQNYHPSQAPSKYLYARKPPSADASSCDEGSTTEFTATPRGSFA